MRRWDKKPLSAQLIARRDYRRTVEELAPMIESHIRELDDFSAVVDRVESDPSLSARERQIAMRVSVALAGKPPVVPIR